MYTHTYKGVFNIIGEAFFAFIAIDIAIMLAKLLPVIGLPMAALIGLYVYFYPALNTRMNSQIDQVIELKISLPSLPKASNVYVGGLPQITHPNSSII